MVDHSLFLQVLKGFLPISSISSFPLWIINLNQDQSYNDWWFEISTLKHANGRNACVHERYNYGRLKQQIKQKLNNEIIPIQRSNKHINDIVGIDLWKEQE
jgi:hypothetical protein